MVLRRRRRADATVLMCDLRDTICVRLSSCRHCTSPSTDYTLYVRRRGAINWDLEYPAWEVSEDGSLCFRLDDLFPMTPGRYEGEIRSAAGDVVGHVEIIVPRTRLTAAQISRGMARRRMSKPAGASDMFEPLVGWQTRLCDILEPTGRKLPVDSTVESFLCSLTLCKPAQLVIDDGIRQEVIEWRCVSGQIEIDRAADGKGPYRFPRGAEVYFDWTEENVRRAMEGC